MHSILQTQFIRKYFDSRSEDDLVVKLLGMSELLVKSDDLETKSKGLELFCTAVAGAKTLLQFPASTGKTKSALSPSVIAAIDRLLDCNVLPKDVSVEVTRFARRIYTKVLSSKKLERWPHQTRAIARSAILTFRDSVAGGKSVDEARTDAKEDVARHLSNWKKCSVLSAGVGAYDRKVLRNFETDLLRKLDEMDNERKDAGNIHSKDVITKSSKDVIDRGAPSYGSTSSSDLPVSMTLVPATSSNHSTVVVSGAPEPVSSSLDIHASRLDSDLKALTSDPLSITKIVSALKSAGELATTERVDQFAYESILASYSTILGSRSKNESLKVASPVAKKASLRLVKPVKRGRNAAVAIATQSAYSEQPLSAFDQRPLQIVPLFLGAVLCVTLRTNQAERKYVERASKLLQDVCEFIDSTVVAQLQAYSYLYAPVIMRCRRATVRKAFGLD